MLQCFIFSKRLTEKHCLQNCLDISLDIAQQVNQLWEPLRKLALLFNIQTKADFLVWNQIRYRFENQYFSLDGNQMSGNCSLWRMQTSGISFFFIIRQ